MKKFLITGICGFVGRHFLEFLERNKMPSVVMGLDIQVPKFKIHGFNNMEFTFKKIELLNKEETDKIVSDFQPDYILHLASYSSVAFSWKDPIISFQNNTNIFMNLLESVRKQSFPTRILSVGSSEEYGRLDPNDLPLTEEHSLNPVSPYAVARVSQELLSKVYVNGYRLSIVMTRSFNHIGPRQEDIFVISSFIKQLVAIKKSGTRGHLVAGDIEIVRDFVDVRDVVSAYYLLLTKGENGQIYNICSGKGLSLKQILKKICMLLDIEVDIQTDPALIRPDDNIIIVGSNDKISKLLGWKQEYPLEKSLRDMISYWQSQPS
jgi:GDP-4-dehydro-6-deoxy-D-mannose reductase